MHSEQLQQAEINSWSVTQEVALSHLSLNVAKGGSHVDLCGGQLTCWERNKEQMFLEEQNQQCDVREQRGQSASGWLQSVM